MCTRLPLLAAVLLVACDPPRPSLPPTPQEDGGPPDADAAPVDADAGDAGRPPDARPPAPDAAADADTPVGDASPADAGEPCGAAPCPAGLVCEEGSGLCVAAPSACRAHDDCAAGQWCADRAGEGTTCEEPWWAHCGQDADCPAHRVCDRMVATCVPTGTCDSDQDCATGVCDEGLCTACRRDTDCGRGRTCVVDAEGGAECSEASPCEGDGGCRPGRVCEEGACRPGSCRPDRYEDDDSPGRAGRLAARRYSDLLQCGDETDDWFFTEVPAGRGLLVVLRTKVAGVPAPDLALYGPGRGGEPLLEMAGAGAAGARWVARPPRDAPSRAWLRVVGLAAASVPYELDVRHPADGPCVDDVLDRRPGDAAAAPPPEPGTPLVLCPNTRDTYELDVPEGAVIVARVEQTGGGGELRARLLDPNGEPVAELQPVDGGFSAEVQTELAGRWSLVVAGDAPPAGIPYVLTVRTVVGEVRRLCEDADALEPGVVVGELDGEPSELSASCGPEPGPVAVRRFELEAPRSVRLEVSGATAALRRDCTRAESELHCAPAGTTIAIPALPAGTWWVVVQGPADGGPYWLTLALGEPPPPPDNDACEAATPVEPGKIVSGSTWTAADDATGDVCPEAAPGAGDVFFRLDLEEEALLHADLDADFPALAYVTDGCAGPVLACLPGPALLEAGSYRVVVDGRGPDDQGNFLLALRAEPPPPPAANATCEGAFLVRPGESVRGDTRRGGETRAPSTCGPVGQSGPELAFRLPELPILVVELDAEFDAVLHAASGCGPELPEVLCRAAGRHTHVRLEIPGPVLFVDGATPADAGLFTLTVAEPAAADPACGGEPAVLPLEVGGSTAGAAADLDPGPGCAGPFPLPGPDLVYPVTVAAGDELEAVLRPAGWDGALYVLGSCEDPAATCLAGVDQALAGGDETVQWQAAEDGVAWVVVDAFAGGGDFRLAVGR